MGSSEETPAADAAGGDPEVVLGFAEGTAEAGRIGALLRAHAIQVRIEDPGPDAEGTDHALWVRASQRAQARAVLDAGRTAPAAPAPSPSVRLVSANTVVLVLAAAGLLQTVLALAIFNSGGVLGIVAIAASLAVDVALLACALRYRRRRVAQT